MKKLNQLLKGAAALGLSIAVTSAAGLPLTARAADNNACPRTQNVMKHHQEMRAMRQKMLAQVKAEDATLTKLAAELKQAPEAKKVDLMAKIVTKLVAERHHMLGEWESMHPRMMGARNGHMPMANTGMSMSSMKCMPGKTTQTAQK